MTTIQTDKSTPIISKSTPSSIVKANPRVPRVHNEQRTLYGRSQVA
eukprot:CAMPEP_0194026172 /NCGR_PEP_ID=MMETSP0009_2-20130614/486_1 /TAXON_ID=210454 /ORGANISM="Grammatophora oceanica, Strain CCMP 410" /LENGTH=45 /DNA_ID= /DNA_START= /DNA_END= /DNA_ORIENTATION=